MSHDALIDFEADNHDDLADKFIEKNREKWDDFVYDQFTDRPMPEPPDRLEEE